MSYSVGLEVLVAALGQVREAFWPGCSPEREAFAGQFRVLIRAMGAEKQGARAGQLAMPLSTLSNYWSGRRMPRLPRLREIYGAVCHLSASAELPVALDDLEALRSQAVRTLEADRQAAAAIADRPAVLAREEPFVETGRVPAEGPAQDRRSEVSGRTREALEILRTARASGDLRNLVGTAWSASRTLSEEELCGAVGELHATDDLDLAETLLLADAQRGTEATMRLALALMGAGLASAAELVMRASLPLGGGERR
ncbi:hypothetical protein ACIQCR_14575 [Streptomyces sp. NPDC093249]|uniref:hypothetical protein n=1 Tax=unclassified Streptomyces TaxID=2593676 RepID=UPI00344F07EB